MFTLNDSVIDVTCFFKFPISGIQFGFGKKLIKLNKRPISLLIIAIHQFSVGTEECGF